MSPFTEGSRPRRRYSAFAGHDGAAHIVALLQKRGIRPWLVLDEGGPIVTGQIPGVAGPVALVGVSEKLSVKVRCAITCAIVSLSTNGHKFDH